MMNNKLLGIGVVAGIITLVVAKITYEVMKPAKVIEIPEKDGLKEL